MPNKTKERLIKLLLDPILLPLHKPKDRMKSIAEAYANHILADDFIQVTRCKKCRFYKAGHNNGLGWCEYFNTGATDNHYCGHGERRDD